MTRHDDDEDGILRDGETFRVTMMMRDHLTPVQRAVQASQQHDAAARFGLADAAQLHRPGYRHNVNAAANAQRQQAYADAEHALCNAWRGEDEDVIKEPSTTDAYQTYDAELAQRWRNP